MKDKIAVIDDHADSLDLLREALSPNYEVETFSDPITALEKIKAGIFSVVVTDVMMPKLNGVELMSKILETAPNLPVILITAFGTLEAAASTIKTGAFDYLSKPLNLNEIRLVVSNAVSHFHVAHNALQVGEIRNRRTQVYQTLSAKVRRCFVFSRLLDAQHRRTRAS